MKCRKITITRKRGRGIEDELKERVEERSINSIRKILRREREREGGERERERDGERNGRGGKEINESGGETEVFWGGDKERYIYIYNTVYT